jgi:phytanoyl-CoA hydroxylase
VAVLYDLVAVLIHLDEATRENGCLRIIPGSHHQGPQMHVFAKDGAFSSKLADQAVLGDESSWHYAECPAGGVELHHCNMLHSSTANLGTNPRSVIVFQFRAADNVLLGGSGGAYGHGTIVRGENPYQARLLDGTIVKLPGEIKDHLQRDG